MTIIQSKLTFCINCCYLLTRSYWWSQALASLLHLNTESISFSECKTLDSCRYWRITWGSQNYEKFEGSTNPWKALLPPSQRCFKMMNTEYCWLGWKLSKTVSVWALQLVCTKLFLYSICSKVPHKFLLSAKPSIKLNLLFRRQFLSTENVGSFDN